MRYAISSAEEVWVRSCASFFDEYGDWEWYETDFEEAFHFIMKQTNGAANPLLIQDRLKKLYLSVGIKVAN
jgi:hypothetical protein